MKAEIANMENVTSKCEGPRRGVDYEEEVEIEGVMDGEGVRYWEERTRVLKESGADARSVKHIGKEKPVREDEGEGEGKRASGDEFLKEVMEAVRLTRQPTPWMVRREKLVRIIKHDMERMNSRPGSFVAESLRYNQNLARAYLRFGLQRCPSKDELAIRENRMLRRKMMMLSQEE